MSFENVYGAPPAELTSVYVGARQFSPLSPGAERLSAVAPGSLNGIAMLAPPGAVERRRALALALRALAPGARLVAMAPKDKGGSRLAGDLGFLGARFEETSRRHHRICEARGPGDAGAIEAAIAAGEPRLVAGMGLWSQPGVFSWDRLDPGSALLRVHLPALSGDGADLGCGNGALSIAALSSAKISRLTLIDIDRRAIDMAVTYAKDRTQFGRPIGSYQAVKHLLANAQVKVEFARPVVHAAAAELALGSIASRARVAHAKIVAAEAVDLATRNAVQVHGAMGMTWEVDLHFWVKRAIALQRSWGTPAAHYETVMDRLRALPTGPDLTFASAFAPAA